MDILWGFLQLDQHITLLIAQHGSFTYAILFGIVFCEMGLLPLFFLPGDPLLFFCGALCAAGVLQLGVLLPLLFAAAVLGSLLNYALGALLVHKLGDRLFSQRRRWLDREALSRAQTFYSRYGGLSFLLSPFIAVVRTFAPFVAGISAMRKDRFCYAMMAGAALWVGSLLTAGYFLGNIPLVRQHISAFILVGLALGLGSLAISALLRQRRPSR